MHQALFIIQFIFFIFLAILCFTIPGSFLLQKLQIKLPFWEKIILGTVLGWVTFTLIGYVLLGLKLSLLLIPLIFILDITTLKSLFEGKKNFSIFKLRNLPLLLIFIVGILGQLLIIAPSGIIKNNELLFWSANGHDGSWHIALMEEFKKGFPFQNPVFAGENLVNYHFFSDISPSLFNYLFKLSTLDLYFRFFPFLFSLLLGTLAYILGKRLGGEKAGIWSVIFTYFAGSFGYIVTLFQNRGIGGESIFWVSQIQSSTGNPPLITSFIIILTILLFLKILLDNKKLSLGITLLLMFLLGTIGEFKSYGGIVILLSLGIVGFYQTIRQRRVNILFLSIAGGIISFILYSPYSKGITQFLIFEPWWFIRTMIVAPERLNWLDLELKRQTYLAEGNLKRVIQIELTGFFIFLFGNLGMRFLGFIYFIKLLKSIFSNYFNLLICIICLISFILPLLFLQKGVAGNTIQFMHYFLLIFGILSAVTISKLLEKSNKFFKLIFTIMIVVLMVPTQVGLIKEFYSRPAFAKIDQMELSALDYLKNKTDSNSIILTPPYNKNLHLDVSTPPIWAWFDTAYVSAFSARRSYFADSEQADIMGYDIKTRMNFEDDIFSEIDPFIFEKKLKEKKINYLYFPKLVSPKVNLFKTSLIKVFSNSEIEIWKI